MTSKNYNFDEIVKQFKVDGKFIKAEPYTGGHINDTFAVYFEKENKEIHRYIFQRINHLVFKNPEKLMCNIENITKYLRENIIKNGGDPNRETLTLIPIIDNKPYYIDGGGNYWRVYVFIEDAKTYQFVEKPEHFYKSGKAFGKFQRLLNDYPAHTLHETIPNFHHTPRRFDNLIKAIQDDVMGRAKDVADEIEFALSRKDETSVLVNLLEQGKLPLHVTHNDTKLSNVILDDITGDGICIIDLDTVMPGLSLYDFGDSIRFGASTAVEDEPDLSKVELNLPLFEEFTKGFLEEASECLTETEIEHLAFSAKLMTLECGVRFLTDHLNGDVYFKIDRENHNLDRCRTQFKLVDDMEQKMDKMKKIVCKYSKFAYI